MLAAALSAAPPPPLPPPPPVLGFKSGAVVSHLCLASVVRAKKAQAETHVARRKAKARRQARLQSPPSSSAAPVLDQYMCAVSLPLPPVGGPSPPPSPPNGDAEGLGGACVSAAAGSQSAPSRTRRLGGDGLPPSPSNSTTRRSGCSASNRPPTPPPPRWGTEDHAKARLLVLRRAPKRLHKAAAPRRWIQRELLVMDAAEQGKQIRHQWDLQEKEKGKGTRKRKGNQKGVQKEKREQKQKQRSPPAAPGLPVLIPGVVLVPSAPCHPGGGGKRRERLGKKLRGSTSMWLPSVPLRSAEYLPAVASPEEGTMLIMLASSLGSAVQAARDSVG
jgi:hypothetical protein